MTVAGNVILALVCGVVVWWLAYVAGRRDYRSLVRLRAAWRAQLRSEITNRVTADLKADYDAELIRALHQRTTAEVDAEAAQARAAELGHLYQTLRDELETATAALRDLEALAADWDARPDQLISGAVAADRIRRTLLTGGGITA